MVEVEFWVNNKVTLEERLAKRYAALLGAGVKKTELLRRALVFFLDREPVEILKTIGLVDGLGDPSAVMLPKFEYEYKPETVVAAAEQGKK